MKVTRSVPCVLRSHLSFPRRRESIGDKVLIMFRVTTGTRQGETMNRVADSIISGQEKRFIVSDF